MFRETRQTNAMTSQLLICNRPIRRTIFRQEPDPICVQRFDDSHYISQLAVFFINARILKITAESCLSVPDIQTQLAFEIPYGQPRDSSANEPSAYASCLNLVLSRVSIATKIFQTHVRSFRHMQL